jgi:hypothetical protein
MGRMVFGSETTFFDPPYQVDGAGGGGSAKVLYLGRPNSLKKPSILRRSLRLRLMKIPWAGWMTGFHSRRMAARPSMTMFWVADG